ncbi:MAG: putative ABC transport system ATP-binding protein [Saprospiraceae bacterium]|jgi:putative ABC transport system ATP-binding protein
MILLSNVKPDPIFDGGKANSSNIWASECVFEKGKHYLITAPSGKGKSTLLHLIYGLRNDYSGKIAINEQAISNFKPDDWSALRQQKLSIVFQDLRLFPNLSALENIELKNDLSAHKSKEEIIAMAEKLGVSDLLNKPCNTLSYGQRQRIAIIRSLCQPFDFLLLDEPFSHLDDDNIDIASSLILKEVEEQKAAMLLVSLGEPFNYSYDRELLL